MCSMNDLLENLMESDNYEDKKNETIKKIKNIIANYSRFKIGKTGQNLNDRFKSEYKNDYDEIIEVFKSSNKNEVDSLEVYLINYIKNMKEYSSKCDNERLGSGEMGTKSKAYYVYVVVKNY